jgi:hypothetical protein
VPAPEELAGLFLRANTERHLVGISVGIGSNRRRKLFQIQLVMALGDCRPGGTTQRLADLLWLKIARIAFLAS